MKSVLLFFVFISSISIFGQADTKPPQNQQFVYIIKLTEKYQNPQNWDVQAQQTAGRHMQHLSDLRDKGTLIFAGRTNDNDLLKLIGFVVFNAKSLEEAKEIADSDPGVKEGMMTIEVFPFWIAMQAKNS